MVHSLVAEVLLLLLAEDLQLKEELLLLEEAGVGGVHGRRRFLCLLVGRNVLVVLQFFHLRFDVFGLFVPVFGICGRFVLLISETNRDWWSVNIWTFSGAVFSGAEPMKNVKCPKCQVITTQIHALVPTFV